jgi:hypothetical protein
VAVLAPKASTEPLVSSLSAQIPPTDRAEVARPEAPGAVVVAEAPPEVASTVVLVRTPVTLWGTSAAAVVVVAVPE